MWEDFCLGSQSSIVRFGNGVETYSSRICSIPHREETPPTLRPKAYKARVGGVSSRCGIEQIRED